MISTYLTDIIVRNQVYLERLKANDVTEFNAVLYALNRAIADALGRLAGSQLSDLSRPQLESFLAALQDAQQALMTNAIATFQDKLKAVAAYQSTFETSALTKVIVDTAAAAVTAEAAYQAAIARPLAIDGGLLGPFIDKLSQGEVLSLTNIIRRGYVEQWTAQQILRAIQGTKALRYRDGLLAKVGRANEAVVRTSIQHVASTARFVTWEANADIVTGYRWVSVLDSRTTVQCRSLDGDIFEIGKGPVPPIHINCRSTTVAELDDRLKVLSDGRTRASADGPVDANTTYYTWLKQQPAAFQDSVIGPKRGALLRNGGLSAKEFAALQLDRNFQPLTLDEMRKLEPHAFELAGI